MGKTNEDCKVMGLNCFICDANKRFERDGYLVCNDCGHEELIDWTKQSFIINDPLNKNKNFFADFINIVLLPICVLIGYTFAIFEGLFPKRQSVLTIIYAKQ